VQVKGWERFERTGDSVEQLRGAAANEMERVFYAHTDRVSHKWHDYLAVYDRHAARFRDKQVVFLEIGVCHGGSLQVWKEYLGPRSQIHGVDLLNVCREAAEARVKVHTCDTGSQTALATVLKDIGPIDIVLDDGSHLGADQKRCFEQIFPQMRDGGVYLVEDLQCSYWRDFSGGYRRRGTFIEYSKNLIDRMHAWYIADDRIDPNEWFARNIRSISFYDGIMAIEKGPKQDPFHVRVGRRALPVEAEITRLKAEGRWPC
jgi:hypothetical protein